MTMNSTDETLMSAVRDGGQAELGVLFERHHRALYEFFFHMTGDRRESENLVQDVFSRILKFRDTFREEGRFRPWLFRIARNAYHDHFRNPQVDPPASELEPPILRNVSPRSIGPMIHEIAESLQSALLNLPEDRREVIVLSQYHGMTSDDLAELLDVDEPAARVRTHRAMMELREIFRRILNENRSCDVTKSRLTSQST
ncbi:MAG TPA: RNA polymerase sigma factor [Terriglobia bacterium]|nr:RNA polymerase sigma factor [Terriglobia bacterium]